MLALIRTEKNRGRGMIGFPLELIFPREEEGESPPPIPLNDDSMLISDSSNFIFLVYTSYPTIDSQGNILFYTGF